MADRSLWFEAHLFADRGGRKARMECERLGPQSHERILATGDRLARTSPAVAQQFYRHAAAVWQVLGPRGFDRWVGFGQELLRPEAANRDAALAYFSVDPKAVGRAGLAGLAAWCATGKRLADISRRLAATFFEGTARVVDVIAPEALEEWARHAARLHGVNGWRGEFLARAYLGTAAAVLPVLRVVDVGVWADLGVALQPAVRERRFFGELPPGFSALDPAARGLLLATALEMARVHPAAAATFYQQLPRALRRLRPTTRTRLLEIFRVAGPEFAGALAEIVPVVGALVHDIPRQHRQAALDLAAAVARQFPRGSAAALRSLPVAYDDASHAAVQQWVRRGLEVAAENADAGAAYFALESRTSLKVLHDSSTAAALTEVQGVLRKYVQMLSGQPVSIRAADVFQLRSPLEEFPLENEIALPVKIDLFTTHEANCAVYRFLAAQMAGRREFRTYEADLPGPAKGLVAFLRAPEHPELLEELFLVAEGFRVGAALARAYPGLAGEERDAARQFLAHQDAQRVPSQAALLDALLACLLSGRQAAGMPAWLRPMAALVAPCVAPLASREATVNDALAVAQHLTAQLAVNTEQRTDVSMGDLLLDKVAGDALLDPSMDDAAPGVAAEAPDVQTTPAPPPPTLPDGLRLQLAPLVDAGDGRTSPLSAEELQRLIAAGADLRLQQGYADDVEGLGLYITDLLGKVPAEQLEELRRLLRDASRTGRRTPRRWLESEGEGAAFYYDEWDYHIGDYRQRWCRLRELAVEGDAGEFFAGTLGRYTQLIPEVRRQFQRIRPEMYRTVKGLEDGEDFDLNAVVSARVDRRARRPPSAKLYVARVREERDVATLFLIDMSASTDEPLHKPPAAYSGDHTTAFGEYVGTPALSPRRIIDVTKEALVIMAQALEEIGDAYAIYGFSGHGRANVEFYLVKSFNEPLSPAVKGRIGALEPKRSTRMGTALRHAAEKLASVNARSRHIMLLSDGFPQDFDYGQDRRSNIYGLRDTTVALRETEAAGITPFCITVDKAGHDYLREMCDTSRYMVIEDIAALPRELPKIYQRVVAA